MKKLPAWILALVATRARLWRLDADFEMWAQELRDLEPLLELFPLPAQENA